MNHPSREEFLEILRQRCKFKPKIKTIPVEKSLGRTLACDVFSRRDIPAARSSALDGIAFKFENLSKKDEREWVLGDDYAFGNTGVGIDDEFDTVVRISVNLLSTPNISPVMRENGQYEKHILRVESDRGRFVYSQRS